MRKSLALLAIIAPMVLFSDVASAATVKQCQTRLSACIQGCFARHPKTGTEQTCTNRCYDLFTSCMQPSNAGGGKLQVQRGPNVVITPTGTGGGVKNPPVVPPNHTSVPLTKVTAPLNPTIVRPGPSMRPHGKGR